MTSIISTDKYFPVKGALVYHNEPHLLHAAYITAILSKRTTGSKWFSASPLGPHRVTWAAPIFKEICSVPQSALEKKWFISHIKHFPSWPWLIFSPPQVDLKRTFTFRNSKQTYTGIPIIAANMDTTGTFEMARVLSKVSSQNWMVDKKKHNSIIVSMCPSTEISLQVSWNKNQDAVWGLGKNMN